MNNTEKGAIGEEFVNNIAYNSFLKYWCYPGPIDEEGDKKEICDLLILFHDISIIVSVKNYQFKGNYGRYFRNTTDKALKQIQGAERKLFGARDIFIKHPDREKELFEKNTFTKTYRIIVNLGDGLKFYEPSQYTKNGDHVTIMEKSSWEGIIQELDTISDFTRYLDSRENLFKTKPVLMMPAEEYDWSESDGSQFLIHASEGIRKGPDQILISGTENDLLSLYISNNYDYPENVKSEEYNGLMLQIDGEWDKFISKEIVKRKKEKDKVSYFIDEFVTREILPSPNGELLAKKLMTLSRFDRRLLADTFFDFIRKHQNSGDNIFARGYREFGDKAFVLVYYSPNMKQEHVQIGCSLAMDSFAIYTNYRVKEFILLGTTFDMVQFKCGYSLYEEPFSEEQKRLIMEDAKKLGWFTNLEEGRGSETEY